MPDQNRTYSTDSLSTSIETSIHHSYRAMHHTKGSKCQTDLWDFSVPPKIEPFTFPQNIQAGARVHVTCVVSEGDPPVHINWLKDGRPLKSHSDLGAATSSSDEFALALKISSATPAHNGNYTCSAKNDAAVASRTASLLVHGTTLTGDQNFVFSSGLFFKGIS